MELKDWGLSQLGEDIWKNKYQYEGESFDEWLDRVSGGDKELRKLIEDKKFLFGGRILSNRGLDKKGKKITLSNCYVLTTDDSIEDIYQTCSDLARTFSYGGGVGVDISKLRPKGMRVNNASKYTTGACSFMDTFSQVTETIGQNGRRGALMLSIDCTHPELIDFINIKTDLDKVTKANISVRITDDFMILEYKDGSRDFVSLDNNVMKNSSSGFYVTIKLSTKLKEGSTFKEGDIVAYDESSFCDSVGTTDNISYSLGPMTKFAIMNASEGYEDSAIVTAGLSEDLASDVVILEHGRGFVIPKDADIFNFIKKGQFVKEGDE